MRKKPIILLLLMGIMFVMCGCGANKNLFPQEQADYEMSLYYFDEYEFIEQEYDKDSETTYTDYNVTYSGQNISYNGTVTLISTAYGDDYWESELVYNDNFDWNINGLWVADGSDLDDYISVSLDVQNVDSANGTIDFCLDVHRVYDDYPEDELKTESSGNTSESVVIDYTGQNYLWKGDKFILDEYEIEENLHNPPSLSFECEFDDRNEFSVVFDDEYASIAGSGRMSFGLASGKLYNNCNLVSYINNYGYKVIEREENN